MLFRCSQLVGLGVLAALFASLAAVVWLSHADALRQGGGEYRVQAAPHAAIGVLTPVMTVGACLVTYVAVRRTHRRRLDAWIVAVTRTRSRRSPAVLAVLLLAPVLAGCETTFSSEQADRASRQALEQLAAAPELPIESVVFTVGPGDKVEATATRWLEQGEPAVPIEERRLADVLWTTSIAELHSVQVETVPPTGPEQVVRFDERQLRQMFGPRPPGVVQVSAADLAAEQRGLLAGMGLAFGLPVLVTALWVVVLVVGATVVVGVLVSRASSAGGRARRAGSGSVTRSASGSAPSARTQPGRRRRRPIRSSAAPLAAEGAAPEAADRLRPLAQAGARRRDTLPGLLAAGGLLQ
jgi:hypothetical protein